MISEERLRKLANLPPLIGADNEKPQMAQELLSSRQEAREWRENGLRLFAGLMGFVEGMQDTIGKKLIGKTLQEVIDAHTGLLEKYKKA